MTLPAPSENIDRDNVRYAADWSDLVRESAPRLRSLADTIPVKQKKVTTVGAGDAAQSDDVLPGT